jgi:P27 family predicted phage terminase small subunit
VLKVLSGTFRKDRATANEPKPKAGAPSRPPFLAGAAAEAWDRTETVLSSMRVLTTADGDALTVYAEAFKRWRECEDWIALHGLVYPIHDEKGRVKCMVQWPQVSIARQMMLVLRAYQQEFGLTPAARSRVNAAEAPGIGALNSDADFA